ncbi:MAG: hypothetical protein RR394_06920 [Oscillospiraceae bacterium]
MMVLQLPDNIDAKDPQKAIGQLWDYLLSFQEQISVILRNLDAENFTDAGLKEIADMFTADTIISNTNITQEIYASYGNIANLTVYKLRTDYEKAHKYLNSDTSDVDYISIHDETISFISAKKSTGTSQLVDGNERFYWTDETHKQMTSEKVTEYPVLVYNYREYVKANIAFQTIALPDNGSTVMPVFTLGVGTGVNDNGKGFIYKGMDGLYLDYHSSIDGSLRRIMLSDSGVIISPYELKALDIYDNGFRAAYDGETVAMTWTLDASGRITTLTTADNVAIPVAWHTGNM